MPVCLSDEEVDGGLEQLVCELFIHRSHVLEEIVHDPLGWYVTVGKQVFTRTLDDLRIVCNAFLDRYAVQEVVNQESGGLQSRAPVHSFVQRHGAVDGHELGIALVNDALSVLLLFEGSVLEEEVVDLLDDLVRVGVFAGGQDGRAKVHWHWRSCWCRRWRVGAASVNLWRSLVTVDSSDSVDRDGV